MLFAAVLVSFLLLGAGPADAQVSIQIGINVPVFPHLVRVPGYPVYYSPGMSSNYFFYDGLYWVFWQDSWYESAWYNGPWRPVGPESVPLFVLRVPVRYYHRPPPYFHGWRGDAPPRWGEHWGREWEMRRSGWDRWDRHGVPPPAPLPSYQQRYSGNRYPRAEEQQHSIRAEHYRYQPHDAESRQHDGGGGPGAPPQKEHESRATSPDRGWGTRNAPQDRGHPDRAHPDRAGAPDRAPQGGLVRPTWGQEGKRAPQDRAHGNGPAPHPAGGREGRAQERGKELRVLTPDRGREAKPAPQGKGREGKPAPPDKHGEKHD